MPACLNPEKRRALERSRIRFERDFGIGRQRDARPHAGQDPVDRLRSEQAGRAAAEKNRVHATAPDRGQRELEIREQRIDIARFGNFNAPLMRIEIAIRTLPEAPGNVDVQRERRQRREMRRLQRQRGGSIHRALRKLMRHCAVGRAAPASPCRGATARSCAPAASRRRSCRRPDRKNADRSQSLRRRAAYR